MTNPRPRLSPWQTIPWHPVVLVAVVVLAFWMDAVVSPYAAARSLLIALVAAGLLTLIASVALRNRHAGGVFVTGLMAVLYTKHLVRLVTDLGPRMAPLVLVVWLIAMALAGVLVVRIAMRAVRRMSWPQGTWFLNRVALVLLIGTLGAGLINGKFQGALDDLSQGGTLMPDDAPGAQTQPDIYVLLMDGYPRADVLEYAFDYDNAPFENALAQRGFEIAAASHSDYLWTHVSLTSMLHMAYVEQIPELQAIVEGRAPLYPGLYDTVNHNPVFDEARDDGYRVVGISGGFEQLALRQADVFLDSGEMNEFELKLLNSTYLGQVASFVAPTFASGQHAERIHGTLDLVADVAETAHAEPQLVVAHVPTPHQPTVFRKDGSVLPVPINDEFFGDSPIQKGMSRELFVQEYRDHLDYLNDLVLDALDRVIAASAVPPVIVLVADHGSASSTDWLVTQPADAPPAELLERTGTLFAARTQGQENVFPSDISPASLFRYLFDAYFGTDYGPAEPPVGGGQVAPVDPSVLTR